MRALILLTLSALTLAAQVEVQWSLKDPQSWEPVSDWRNLPKLPDPQSTNERKCCADNKKGWVAGLRVAGDIISGFDHYFVSSLENTTTVIAWHNAQGGRGPLWKTAIVKSFKGTKLLTSKCFGSPGCLPWERFTPPPDDNLVRHGIWIAEDLWDRHRSLR
jgi:hypothetical protein